MKITYIIKKGVQCYPPCLAQILYLNDFGIDITVYHGKNSDYINKILDGRSIKHYELKTDRTDNATAFQSICTLLAYTREIKKIIKNIDDSIIWFGNCESAVTLNKYIKKRTFVLNVLELYNRDSWLHKKLKKTIKYTDLIVCCEKHRAVLMQDMYALKSLPFVVPNKPYPIEAEQPSVNCSQKIEEIQKVAKDKKIIIYQGIISEDRPIDNVAKSLNIINDDSLTLAIMGKTSSEYEKKIKSIYSNTVFLGYIPAPEHLRITQLTKIGIAIYDTSCLNNQFCAPNKIYEYGKYGIPMITSKNLGLVETVGQAKAGVCLDFGNIDKMAISIKDIIENYEYYSQNAKKMYNETNIKSLIEDIVVKIKTTNRKQDENSEYI